MSALLDTTEIEKAAEARLVEMIPTIRKTAIQKDGRYLFTNPALSISIFESGTWPKEGKRSYLVPCSMHVLLTVSSAKSEEDRRRIANPLVFAIIVALAQQSLGLDLKEPGCEPKRFADVTDEDDWKNNKIVYLVEFGLGFYFEVPKDDEAAADLIGVAVDYFLEPGNEVADAQDEITVEG
jgi:hypothetical protein